MQEKATLNTPIETQEIRDILDKHANDKGGLISILEAIQARYGYLPEEALRIVSEQTGRSLVDVYGVATFYRFFSLQPKGRHLICTCLGTACHVRGAPRIVTELEQQLGIKAGQTTEDMEFTLETVNCLGACALGPVVVIDGHYFSQVSTSKVKDLLDQARQGFDAMDFGSDQRIFPIDLSCPQCRESFKDETFTLDGLPCLKINAVTDRRPGWIRLSCLYGSTTVASEYDISDGSISDFVCPHCNTRIHGNSACSRCEAPMVRLPVEGGGVIQICTRRGCTHHLLDVSCSQEAVDGL